MTLVRLNQRNCAPAHYWNPGYNDQMTRAWNEFGRLVRHADVPAANIVETDENFRIELSVPGFRKSDFKIRVEDNILIISGEFAQNSDNESFRYTRYEFGRSSFSRRFRLSNWVDSSGIGATCQDGILMVTIPKKEEAKSKPARDIEIS